MSDSLWNTMVSFIMWQQDSITVKSWGLYRRRICQIIMSFMRQDILLQESMSTARFTLTAKRTKNGMTAILMTWNLTLRWHLLMSLKNSKKLMMKISMMKISRTRTSMMRISRTRILTIWTLMLRISMMRILRTSFMRKISGFLRIRSLHARTCRSCRLQQKSVKISGYQTRRALHMHSMVQI